MVFFIGRVHAHEGRSPPQYIEMATAAGTRDISVSQGPGKLIFVIFFCSTNMVFLQVGDMRDDDERPRHHIETAATAAAEEEAGVGARDA